MTPEDLAAKIAAEPAWSPRAAAAHDRILAALDAKLTALMARDPNAVLTALAVVIPLGPGRDVLILADPAAQDIADELKRYADAGEPSPLAALAAARIRL